MSWTLYPKNLSLSILIKLKKFPLLLWPFFPLSLSLSPNKKRSNCRNTSSRDKYILFVILSSYTNLSLEYTFLILYLTTSGFPITLSRHVSIRITDDITHSVFSSSISPPFSLTGSPTAHMQQLYYILGKINQNHTILFHLKNQKPELRLASYCGCLMLSPNSGLTYIHNLKSYTIPTITATK